MCLFDGVVVAFVGNTLADNGIIIIGGAEVLPQCPAQFNVFGEGFVHLLPVTHSIGYDNLESDGIAVFIAGSVGFDDFDGAVKVLHSLFGLGVHLNVG